MALVANLKHGKRLTNADKRRNVRMALEDPVLKKMSDRELAKLLAVSHELVRQIRLELSGGGGSKAEPAQGKAGKGNTPASGRPAAAQSERKSSRDPEPTTGTSGEDPADPAAPDGKGARNTALLRRLEDATDLVVTCISSFNEYGQTLTAEERSEVADAAENLRDRASAFRDSVRPAQGENDEEDEAQTAEEDEDEESNEDGQEEDEDDPEDEDDRLKEQE
jgi:hypothetical protein